MIENTSLQFIQGILHTYAGLNTPNANLTYEYELFQIESLEDVKKHLGEHIILSEDCTTTYQELNIEEFKQCLYDWFFNFGELASINLNNLRKLAKINYFYKLVDEVLKIQKITKINYSKLTYEPIHFDCICINGYAGKYIIYLCYWD